MQRTLFRHAALQSLFVVVLLFHGGLSSAQEMTPSAAGDPCLAAPGAGTPWPIGPGMMQTPGAMGPGMMTPGAMGPGMMDDANLMVATMLLANDRIDEALRLPSAASNGLRSSSLPRMSLRLAMMRAPNWKGGWSASTPGCR